MPLANDPREVREIVQLFRNRQVSIAAFCTENADCTQALMTAAQKAAEELRLARLPFFLAATGRYNHRAQLANYTALKDAVEGFMAFRDDVRRLSRTGGPFPNVSPIPFFDHGQPGADADLFEMGIGFWGGVMFDASELPIEQNIELTRKFVARRRGDCFIEGICDQVACAEEPGRQLDEPTTPEQARRYMDATGVDALVVNLGTEHRSMGARRQYMKKRAHEIRDAIGHNMVLHGTSCLRRDEVATLREDGILKVNLWTTFEVETGRNVARDVLRNLPKMLPAEEIKGLLLPFQNHYSDIPEMADLDHVTHIHRRDDIMVPTITRLAGEYFRWFGYERLRGA
ncbi:MAG TPA: class II fructose-bisphosphate aldolase [Candidatus Brocadiia bacterium]|nr:class II fructose-bisphosphate aldolase [Candidatus Brocadiia bacterium]